MSKKNDLNEIEMQTEFLLSAVCLFLVFLMVGKEFIAELVFVWKWVPWNTKQKLVLCYLR